MDARILTQERLKELLHYDPLTGIFTRLMKTSISVNVGDIAGSIKSDGRIYISLNNKLHLAHRLAYLYVNGQYPKNLIDHVNGNSSDNRWENLRDATKSENNQNQRKARNCSKTGYLGVSRSLDKFIARIGINGTHKYIGRFDTAEKAHEAYVKAKRIIHSHCTI